MTNYISLKESILEVDEVVEDKSVEILNEDGAARRLMNRRVAMKKVFGYVMYTTAVALFGAIYEYFSFGVYSYYMLYAFMFPLILGIFPWLLIAMDVKCRGMSYFPGQKTAALWGAGITTLTVGSVLHGVLDIYGTTSTLTKYYFIVGTILLLTALVKFMGRKKEA